MFLLFHFCVTTFRQTLQAEKCCGYQPESTVFVTLVPPLVEYWCKIVYIGFSGEVFLAIYVKVSIVLIIFATQYRISPKRKVK